MIMKITGQDGGIGRHTVPPRTTKRRSTTILKTKNNQNCQKIELYGSPTTKELKKKHSFRLVEGWRQVAGGQRGCTARQWLADSADKAAAGGPGGHTSACR